MFRSPNQLAAAALVVSAAAQLLSVAPASAVHTTYWTVTRTEDFQEGTIEKLSLQRPGTLSLSPAVEPVGDVGALYAWSLAAAGDGGAFVGTGDEGKIYKIAAKGEPIEWFDTIELEILSLAIDKKGALYAGGSPDGSVYKITGKGEGKTFVDTPESYVWAMAFDNSGRLYAATGTRGLIYRIDASGSAEIFYDTHDKNVLSLVFDPARKALIAGTEGRGLVIEIGLDGTGRVLFDSGHEEIGGLALDADGALYVAGSGRSGDNGTGDDDNTSKPTISDGGGDPSTGGTGGSATVYRITRDGVVSRLWVSDESFIYSLLLNADGDLIAGTGNEGGIYRLTPKGDATLLAKLDESQVLDLVGTPAGVLASTGNLANVYRIGPLLEKSGTARSIAYNARNSTRWGSVSWLADAPAGTRVVLRSRSGNTDQPDETWSKWSEPLTNAAGSAIASPPSRYFQWEAELTSKDAKTTPRLREVRVSFVQANLRPLVAEVEVFPQGTISYEGEADGRPRPLFQVLPNGVRVEFMSEQREEQFWSETLDPWARAIRSMRWDAIDPNGDILSFDVFYRALDEKRWKVLEEEHEITYLAWDTGSFPDGEYEIKVVASDRLDNPEGEALTAEAVSEPFFVDNTPPEVTSMSASRNGDGVIEVRASARDARSFLKRALYAVDAGEWSAVGAEDKIFDSREERFRFETPKQGEGEHTVVFRVFDAVGNSTVTRAVVQ